MGKATTLSRRSFLQVSAVTGGGLVMISETGMVSGELAACGTVRVTEPG